MRSFKSFTFCCVVWVYFEQCQPCYLIGYDYVRLVLLIFPVDYMERFDILRQGCRGKDKPAGINNQTATNQADLRVSVFLLDGPQADHTGLNFGKCRFRIVDQLGFQGLDCRRSKPLPADTQKNRKQEDRQNCYPGFDMFRLHIYFVSSFCLSEWPLQAIVMSSKCFISRRRALLTSRAMALLFSTVVLAFTRICRSAR
ncbi:hypothetical protein ES703_37951 [subsurface metagenome]